MFNFLQATPRLSEDKVKQCVDPKLNNEYPPKAVAKVISGNLRAKTILHSCIKAIVFQRSA